MFTFTTAGCTFSASAANGDSNVAAGQASARQRYARQLRTFSNQARGLSERVGKGATRDDSAAQFTRLRTTARDVAEEARRMFLPRASIDEIQKSEEIMNQLSVFYTGASGTRPALTGPSKGDGKAAADKAEE